MKTNEMQENYSNGDYIPTFNKKNFASMLPTLCNNNEKTLKIEKVHSMNYLPLTRTQNIYYSVPDKKHGGTLVCHLLLTGRT